MIRRSPCQWKPACRAASVSVRCEQSANQGKNLDVWLGRLAMVGFAVAISVEIATGKGLLEVCHVTVCFTSYMVSRLRLNTWSYFIFESNPERYTFWSCRILGWQPPCQQWPWQSQDWWVFWQQSLSSSQPLRIDGAWNHLTVFWFFPWSCWLHSCYLL